MEYFLQIHQGDYTECIIRVFDLSGVPTNVERALPARKRGGRRAAGGCRPGASQPVAPEELIWMI